ncbi:hypothetical protein FE784_39905 [Paenibacillus hemerocallicola]|uniref:Carboxypeptidase regulatory-like domain-containing protein n=1 Tax=Paenibacillus hemerocallicola TaxID=1172614 RepID=A0A5C4SV78_9BACL|nr:carboxypeptidase-like regulatory domain-containing protein [Paenibacillus hemerocallicola]TNJ54507.1 hypothetical protein FE784_39905 [Paenibacillus hemerocallicola]
MLKIRIKVKHLVLSFAAAGAFVGIFAGIVVPQTELFIARKHASASDLSGKPAIIGALESRWITDKQKWRLIRDSMIEDTPDTLRASDFDLYVGPGFTQSYGNGQERLFSASEKIPYLELYVARAPADGYLLQAAKHLAHCYKLEGKTDRAIAVLEQAAKRLPGGRHEYMRHELAYKAAELFGSEGRLGDAESRLAEITAQFDNGDSYWNGKIAQLRARLLMREGDLPRALERVSSELAEAERPGQGEAGKVRAEQLVMVRNQLESEARRQTASDSGVSGTVKRSDGSPLARTGVFLREERIVNQSVSENDPYQAVTDENGRFAFDGVAPGSYQLYLGLDFEQISGYTWPVGLDEWIDVDGVRDVELPIALQPLIEQQSPVNEATVTDSQITFQWRSVEGAAYYNVNVGLEMRSGSGSMALRTRVPENRLQVPVDRLYDVQTGLSYEKPGDWSTADPAALLGFADPDNRYFWSVEAYDAFGKLLTRSNGYRLDDRSIGNLPFFFLKQRTMTNADKLVADGKFDDAMAVYKKTFENDSSDVHALRMIIRLLQAKATITGDKTLDDEAYPYVKTMLGLRPVQEYAGRLMHYYYEKQNWLEFHAMYDLYARLRGQPISSYEQSIYATALMKQGKYAEAKLPFEEAMKEDGSHRFVGNYLAAVLYADRSVEEALQIAAAYPERSFGPPLRNWRRLVEALQAEADGQAAYFAELNETLDWHFRGREADRLGEWLLSTKETAMKAFVQAVMGVR